MADTPLPLNISESTGLLNSVRQILLSDNTNDIKAQKLAERIQEKGVERSLTGFFCNSLTSQYVCYYRTAPDVMQFRINKPDILCDTIENLPKMRTYRA